MEESKDLQTVLAFIDRYWDKIIHDKRDSWGDPHTVPLPHSYITTNAKEYSHWNGAMFYWDSYFIFRGLTGTKREWIIPKMIDNFIYLFRRYGIIPNANFWSFLGHSQPPFLTSMIFDAYYALQRQTGIRGRIKKSYANIWLRRRINFAQQEYWKVWEDTGQYHHRIKEFGLSRYGDRDVGYPIDSERESGWDFTTRFYSRCNEFLPIDLNSYLHKYEKDFARAATILGKKKDVVFWEKRAEERYKNIKQYLWNEKAGFFFDYDYRNKLQSEYYSLAGFVPMWAKLATYNEAKRMREKLSLFETEYGLTITAKSSLPPKLSYARVPRAYRLSIIDMMTPKQWDYPHIWAPLEYLTVIGLLRYGFIEDGVRIMEKSIKANVAIFKKYGALLEKIDATTGEKPKTFWYPSQLGFGWTNAIFYAYTKILEIIKELDGKIYSDEDLRAGPPYGLNIVRHN